MARGGLWADEPSVRGDKPVILRCKVLRVRQWRSDAVSAGRLYKLSIGRCTTYAKPGSTLATRSRRHVTDDRDDDSLPGVRGASHEAAETASRIGDGDNIGGSMGVGSGSGSTESPGGTGVSPVVAGGLWLLGSWRGGYAAKCWPGRRTCWSDGSLEIA